MSLNTIAILDERNTFVVDCYRCRGCGLPCVIHPSAVPRRPGGVLTVKAIFVRRSGGGGFLGMICAMTNLISAGTALL
jgi:hypothetical protein